MNPSEIRNLQPSKHFVHKNVFACQVSKLITESDLIVNITKNNFENFSLSTSIQNEIMKWKNDNRFFKRLRSMSLTFNKNT